MRSDFSLPAFLVSHCVFMVCYLGTLAFPEASMPSFLKVAVVSFIAFGRIGYLSHRWRRELKMA